MATKISVHHVSRTGLFFIAKSFVPAGRLAFVSSISVALRVLRMLPRLAAPVLERYMIEGVYVLRLRSLSSMQRPRLCFPGAILLVVHLSIVSCSMIFAARTRDGELFER